MDYEARHGHVFGDSHDYPMVSLYHQFESYYQWVSEWRMEYWCIYTICFRSIWSFRFRVLWKSYCRSKRSIDFHDMECDCMYRILGCIQCFFNFQVVDS